MKKKTSKIDILSFRNKTLIKKNTYGGYDEKFELNPMNTLLTVPYGIFGQDFVDFKIGWKSRYF